MDLPRLIAEALIIIWPAYVANATPVIASKLLSRRTPIDMGKYFRDGRRILGDGKTIEGFLFGVTAGTLIGGLTTIIIESLAGDSMIYPTLLDCLSLSFWALVGDLIGAFIKRRLGLPRGAPAPLLDQLDFIVTALLVTRLIDPMVISIPIIIAAVLLTPPIHLATNAAAYLLGLKREPW
ncbi:MAG: CDP-2,3-bis-(O-geranylgeranyl)-sn-glycerol synthase [Thermocladium sp.]